MASTRTEQLNLFDSHPSLSTTSLEDFEARDSPTFRLPSHHSGFRSESSDAGDAESDLDRPWSPKPWRRPEAAGSGWYRHQPYSNEARSRSPTKSRTRDGSVPFASALEYDENEVTIAASIPLPRGSLSPVKERTPSPSPRPSLREETIAEEDQDEGKEEEEEQNEENDDEKNEPENYVRFALSLSVLQSTSLLESAVERLRTFLRPHTRSTLTTMRALVVLGLGFATLRLLVTPAPAPALPNILTVAQLARNFEPLLDYSEAGVAQLPRLQETSIAVWDLAESVRVANMTSAPVLVAQLDALSDSIKLLAAQLSRFHARTDGDVDLIIASMDWAARELAALPPPAAHSALGTAAANLHAFLAHGGPLLPPLRDPDTLAPTTPVGQALSLLVGPTPAERTRHTLLRAYNELLAVLEASIQAGLVLSGTILLQFDGVERQLQNLHRTTLRERDTQEFLEAAFLGSLWTRVLGARASQLRKYEKNKGLLAEVYGRTLANKDSLGRHLTQLTSLQARLGELRQNLVKPLVRGGVGSIAGVGEVVKGLREQVGEFRGVRDSQRRRVNRVLFGVGGNVGEIGG